MTIYFTQDYKDGVIPPIKVEVNVVQENNFKLANTTLIRHRKIIRNQRDNKPAIAIEETPGEVFWRK